MKNIAILGCLPFGYSARIGRKVATTWIGGVSQSRAGAERLGFEVDMANVRISAADHGFDAIDDLFNPIPSERLRKANIHREQNAAGTKIHGHGVPRELHTRFGLREPADLT